jgi:hypothetical protein
VLTASGHRRKFNILTRDNQNGKVEIPAAA